MTSKQHDDLLDQMKKAKEQWDAEDDQDETDALLSQAIELAIENGKGWKDGEKEEYMKRITDDDFLPPLFATTQEDIEKSGMAEAFSSLQYDDPPVIMMEQAKKKGNEAFVNGKKNVAKNVQYYRDAVNAYYESFFWAEKVDTVEEDYTPPVDDKGERLDDIPFYTQKQLDDYKSTLCTNASTAHAQIKNWGYVRDQSSKALEFNKANIKAWFRLAQAQQMLQNWEEAGDAIDAGLKLNKDNKDLRKIQKTCESKIRKARLERQKRERARAERVSKVKQVWKHCKEEKIQLGRVSLVSSVTDEEDENENAEEDNAWHHHHPHSGLIAHTSIELEGEWAWPCMFMYPSHKQSDFIKDFAESEMLAMRMAQVFPELGEDEDETSMPWDYNNEFQCSNLAIYFEVYGTETDDIIHPESVERLKDQAATMKFYEASRALKGDEGPQMEHFARCVERKHLHTQRKRWKKKHGSLWAKPKPNDVVRVHPAVTLKDILTDARCVVPNFLVTLYMFPESHPAHEKFLKEHKCLGILNPENLE